MPITQDQVIAFFGGGVLVFIGDQIATHLRREKRILGYTVETQTIAEKSHVDLKLQYKGIDVERVYLQKITLKNVGNMAIKDVPIYIVPGAAKGVYTTLTADKPGIHCHFLEGDVPCAFRCDLLNPGDTITVDLTVIDPESISVAVDARAEKLVVKEISRERLLTTALDVLGSNASGTLGLSAKIAQVLLKH